MKTTSCRRCATNFRGVSIPGINFFDERMSRGCAFTCLICIVYYLAIMRKAAIVLIIFLASIPAVYAQYESVVQQGEFGITAGAAHYFGDLNTSAKINRPKLAFGVFFRKQFGNYIGLRVGANYARVGYSDVYNTDNEFQQRRNLSFNSNIFELALQGDFNFF